MRGMDRLLELQEIDSAIDRLTHRKVELESGQELLAARAGLEDVESALGELRLTLDAVGHDQSRLEHEIDSMEQKAAVEEKRMYDGSIVNVKELDALQHEIASLKERRSRAEDELLDRMVQREELEGRIAAAERETAAARERVESAGGAASRELDQVGADLASRAAERAALVPHLDADLLELYEDLRPQKKGVAAVALVDGVCQGCHEKLSALELDRLKHVEGVKRCEHCRRIVVFA